MIPIYSILFYIGMSFLIAYLIGKNKTIGFWKSFIFCLLFTPFFGLFIAEGGARKNAKGCDWCGNKYNEAKYCGLCGKNIEGVLRPGFVPKEKN
ncbi:hypothetical protein BH10BAC1_BH10BAC1_08480 [soil metagenome]